MTYELAKTLQDMNFPYSKALHGAIKPDGSARTLGDPEDGIYVIEPTLSELIEACGDKFMSLCLWNSGTWTAQGKTPRKGFIDEEFGGKSAKEAVAKLWLALNKHE